MPRAMGEPSRWRRVLLGDDPRTLTFLLAPTALALVLDVLLRGRVLFDFGVQGKAIYGSSLLISAAFWGLPLWLVARLHSLRENGSERLRLAARFGFAAVFVFWVLPLVTFCFGGQVLYHRVVNAYMGRDTVRLGFALRGTVADWFAAWGSSLAFVAMLVSGVAITFGLRQLVVRAAPRITGRAPVVAVLAFVGALVCFWVDMVDSRFLQASLPDDCFVHGFVHAVRVGVTGKGRTRRGISLRTPAKLPSLEKAALEKGNTQRPNLIVILTESVRADALCSDPPPACQARFLDEVASDRIALGKLTTPSSGTFGACMLLWTGLPVTANVNTAHSAPVLWELARAVGYRTSYVTSQNAQFENFGAFVQRAGIDEIVTATELGGLRQEQLGAPDERATASMLRAIRETPAGMPHFGVLHLSNTHAPYRVEAGLEPFEPHSDNPVGNAGALHNHYRNSVLLQERTIAAFLRELRAMPSWDDTAVVVLSDHGEQFRERGGLYHLHSLFDEEVRIPGFVVGGRRALDDDKRRSLRTFAARRTYLTDVHATLVDWMGLGAVRSSLPFANPDARSLIDERGWTSEPLALMSTATAVWEEDDARFGVMQGERLLVSAAGQPWACFDIEHDQGEWSPLAPELCGRRMIDAAEAAFRR
jgi:hypothetical protein